MTDGAKAIGTLTYFDEHAAVTLETIKALTRDLKAKEDRIIRAKTKGCIALVRAKVRNGDEYFAAFRSAMAYYGVGLKDRGFGFMGVDYAIESIAAGFDARTDVVFGRMFQL